MVEISSADRHIMSIKLKFYYFKKNKDKMNCFKCTGCNIASANGHLECLKYLHENGCPWDKETCRYSTWYGHLECLKYLHENGCPLDAVTCANAAYNGQLECLKYLHENSCPWDKETCRYSTWYGHRVAMTLQLR